MLHGQLLPFWRIMHLILCSTIDPKKHTTEVTYGRAEFLYMVVVRGLHVDMASFIYQSIRAEALKTDAQISLPYGVLLTQFLHNLMMRAVMQLTYEMVGNISSRLAALELKVVSMDAELKKQVSEVQLALKSVATSAKLVALTERVVLLEEHMSDVRAVLHLSDD
ncbi:hypothetical protein CJ030_MR5G024785 [Morella rubra]|uniref:Uncharacterized protein n=1 Tax=Morella rubra TaxID=262757 RepID=A0A6A1VJX2_9ROSI|nr:hypothetical protein CJ030_MR5G024785 [Morella rubra]